MIEFGKTYRDRITGFIGVATGQCSYITGCNQVLLAPHAKPDGDVAEPRWFDVDRVEDAGQKQIQLGNATSVGPDRQAPVK